MNTGRFRLVLGKARCLFSGIERTMKRIADLEAYTKNRL